MQDMINLIQQLSYHHSTSKVFADFVEMSAISFSNIVDKAQFDEREKRYLDIIKHYKQDEVYKFATLLGMLTNHLDEAPRDVLGELFHKLELHNEHKGQFFTPYSICRLMTQMAFGEDQQLLINKHGFMSIAEPACGTGAMIIGFTQELLSHEINYQQAIHVMATDIDPTCVHAAYVQFSLLHIPAVVMHGDSLSMEMFSHWYTLAHVMGGWDEKLKRKERENRMLDFIRAGVVKTQEPESPLVRKPKPNERPTGFGSQLTIF